ncbi:MAG: FHA domain-containing protein [Myxococcales bacterium]|nr:FHA domain-containing protein [Myxococcales bacterium]
MAKILHLTSPDQQEFELSAFNTIGRHPDNTIQILDRIISKEHAQIQRMPDGRFLLRDLGSLNGTYVGGDRVGERLLTDGDEISMGGTRLAFVGADRPEQIGRVTIAPGIAESYIQQRIAANDTRDFLPEREITDVAHLRRDYEKLRLGLELARSIGTELDLDKLLPKIIDKSLQLLGADRGVILMRDTHGEYVPRYMKQKDGRDDSIVLSRTVIGEVISQRAAVLSSDASMDERFSGAHSIIMQGIRSTMTVPLLVGEELLGLMHLDSQIATNAFTEKDLQVFTGIAAQAAVAIENARLAKKIEVEAHTRAQFQRLIPPKVVEQVMSGELTIERGGRLHEITMLFADIRGFTGMSEKSDPQEIVRMLNQYFEVMVDILFKHDGTLDKFVGDEIIGLFGAPIDLVDAPRKAVACAIEMQRALREFNRSRITAGLEPIQIGIGINSGIVVTGAIGSSKALQYTAIGDAMNVASRLCSVAKAGDIIVSSATLAATGDEFDARALPPVALKGKSDLLQVFNVVATRASSTWSEVTSP